MAGFGSGLVAMPLLIALVGFDTASPIFALLSQTYGLLIILRYSDHWNLRDVWHVSAALLVAVPVGVWVAQRLDEHLVMIGLGVLMIIYSVYSLLGWKMPPLPRRSGVVFGFLSGLLQGAYNTGGPPLVMYGSSQHWSPQAFKSNIQSLFFVGGALVVISHFASGHITELVWQYYLVMMPGVLLALVAAFALDRYVHPQKFRTGVLIMLIFLGLTLIF
jgi:hypothetical protein